MSATRSELRLPARVTASRGRTFAGALFDVFMGPVPVLIVAVMMWIVLHGPVPAFDFRFAYWSAGHRVLTGQSPYLWTAAQYRGGFAFVYPALSAVVFAPMALLSRSAGSVLFTLVSACLAPTTLALLGVRDWRAYGITLLWLPVCAGWLTANESLFLMFGLACLWRWRDRPGIAGLLAAVMISLKPIMWPVMLWLLATRRWRASAQSIVYGVLLNVAAWSVVGFGQIRAYLHATATDTAVAWRTGFGVPAMLGHLGAGRTAGVALMLVLALALLVATVHSGFVCRNEVQALTLTVVLTLVASPLVWGHYLTLLLVPLALLRPRLNWLWVVPVLMWICPPDARVHLWQAAFFWLAAGLMLTVLVADAAKRRTSLPKPWRRLTPVQA